MIILKCIYVLTKSCEGNDKSQIGAGMRRLYFDIDGTVLRSGAGDPKPALERGGFEAAIRLAQVDLLVCVGNFCAVVEMIKKINPDYDGLGIVFGLCRGAFADEEWFRSVTTLIADPEHRAGLVDFSAGWTSTIWLNNSLTMLAYTTFFGTNGSNRAPRYLRH
jgi:hypothetical protein